MEPGYLQPCALALDYLLGKEARDLAAASRAAGPLGLLFLTPSPHCEAFGIQNHSPPRSFLPAGR